MKTLLEINEQADAALSLPDNANYADFLYDY